MLKSVSLVISITLILILTSFKSPIISEYDISGIYQPANIPDGAKVLTDDGLKNASTILIPLNIQPGKYLLKVTRKGANIYKVDNKEIYIETKYCYEYSYSEEVILNVESGYGYSKGKLIF